ncbi:TerC family protein [Streptomyces sp. BE308]|uniref:TerC family protein n=1 Tax=Streptomyces sp. BE308 TaxID=3002529 RepID=UPI002E7A0529|nr:TerC family protein [Streptomyces sp. BE308]MEE1795239.1 TerC family protein [Streptomyces sp. BE308]
MLDVRWWLWGAFAATVIVSLVIDLLAHRTAHVIGFKEAALWSGMWVILALAFGAVVLLVLGPRPGTEYATAWLLEKSLSVDNLFVFALIFAYFKVPRAYQHRVLFFGVFGALVFRGIFLSLGVAVVGRFTAVLFAFAAILFYSTYKILRGEEETFDPGRSFAVRLLRRAIPVRDDYAGAKFTVREAGRRVGTPLLAGLLDRSRYLSRGLGVILAIIGVKLILQASHKMIDESIPEIPSLLGLAVIVVVLTVSVVASLRHPQK